MRLEAGRRGSCSFWLAGSCGHWVNTARPLRPNVPPLRVRPRGERQWGGTHTHTETRVTEETVVIKTETRRWLTLLVPQGQVQRLDRAVDKGWAPGSLSPGKDIQA